MQLKKYDEHGRPYIQISEGYEIKLDYSELNEEDKEKARVELRETPENIEKGLKELRELIDADDTLFVPSFHDEWLMRFLRPTKFYAKSAYELMLRYYKFKLKHPELCENLVPKTARLGFQHNIIHFQPVRDQFGRRILIFFGGRDWDPNVVPITDIFRAMQLSTEAALLEPKTQVHGFIVILDFLNLTVRQCLSARPGFSRIIMEYLQECVPLRCKGVHVVNYPIVFQMLYGIFRPFMRGKLKNRVFFHGNDFKSLHDHIDPSCLRSYYAGTMDCEDVDGKLLADVLEEGSDEFELAEKFGIVKNKHDINLEIVAVSDPTKKGAKYVIAKKDEK